MLAVGPARKVVRLAKCFAGVLESRAEKGRTGAARVLISAFRKKNPRAGFQRGGLRLGFSQF